MSRVYNNPEYRAAKRIVAFVNPKLKKLIEKEAKAEKRSVSNVVGIILEQHYGA